MRVGVCVCVSEAQGVECWVAKFTVHDVLAQHLNHAVQLTQRLCLARMLDLWPQVRAIERRETMQQNTVRAPDLHRSEEHLLPQAAVF
jgi:hypothetical protein